MPVRPPAVAGQFYPAGPAQLRQAIERCLGDAELDPRPGGVTALVAPHAGYPYSGPTAGHVFRRVQGMKPGRVVLLGPSHHFRFKGISVFGDGAFQTPLGTVAVDEAFAQRLIDTFGNICPEAHRPEHALEVELPFLQVALQPGFTIVPVLFGSEPDDTHAEIAAKLAAWLEPGDLLLASTDLSHFLPEHEANRLDRHSLDLVLAGDCDRVQRETRDRTCAMCGATAVYTTLAAANEAGATDRTLWDYRTSAWASGDYSRVVGYGGVTLERSGN